jgi:O-antigen ligase
LFLPSVQQQLAWGGLAALAFAAIPLLWREGYTWVILWIAPVVGFDPVPTLTIRVAKYVLVLLAIGAALAKRRLGNHRPGDFDLAPIYACLALLSWLTIRGVTSGNPLDGTGEAMRFAAVAGLLYMWLSEPQQNGGRRRWYFLWLIMAFVEVATCLVQATAFGKVRSYGTFVNANSLGGYLMQTIAIVAAAAVCAPGKRVRGVSILSLPILLYGTYLTGSRGAWLCTTIILLITCALAKAWRPLLAGAVVVLAFAGLYVQDPVIRYATNSVLRLETGATHRGLLWDAADVAIIGSPVVGYGLKAAGSEMERFAKYPSPVHRALMAEIMQHGNPHNFYREILLTCGAVGLALLLVAVILLIRQGWQRLKSRDPWRRVYALALVSVTAGVLVQSYFERSMLLGSMSAAVFYWFVAAQMLRADDPEFAEGQTNQ